MSKLLEGLLVVPHTTPYGDYLKISIMSSMVLSLANG